MSSQRTQAFSEAVSMLRDYATKVATGQTDLPAESANVVLSASNVVNEMRIDSERCANCGHEAHPSSIYPDEQCPVCARNYREGVLACDNVCACYVSRSDISARQSESAWLVESTDSGHPTWLTIVDDKWHFTDDSLKAIRFARKEDAEMLLFPNTHASEHQWG